MGAVNPSSAAVLEPTGGPTARPDPPNTLSYRPDLDGLRSIAVYLVLLFHTGLAWVKGGFIGVDLFFVLSGFLVTSVLLGEMAKTGGIKLGRFYSRRVRRLLPAALVVVVATAATFTVMWSVLLRLEIVDDARSALLYYANWHFVQEAGDYFATDIDKSPFLHFWSLAIEEQFYVVFPVLLLLLSRLRRRGMLWSLVVLLALSLAAQLYWAQANTNHAYYGTDARLYQLLAGAVLAVALHTWRTSKGGRPAFILALAGLAGLLALGSGLVTTSPSVRGIGATAVSVLLIWGMMLGPDQPIPRFLSRPIPVFLGRISYGTYLWHWPTIIALTTLFKTSPIVIACFALGISTGLAALSYEILEMPIRKARWLDRFQWRTAVVGVSASALLAATLVPAMLELNRRPGLSGANSAPSASRSGKGGDTPIPQDLNWRKIAADRGSSHSCGSDEPSACTVRKGAGPHVLFVGDSQAMSFVPMFKKLAEEHDLTLSLAIVPGCPWQEGLDNAKLGPETAETCEEGRVGWYDEALPELDPDVVVLLDRPRDDPLVWGDVVSRRDGQQQPLQRAVFETTRDTLAKISKFADKTVVIERLIMPETFNPVDCLATSTRVGQCAVPVPTAPSASDGYYAAAAAQSSDILTVNLNGVLCSNAPVCLPMDGKQVVWRDDHHYTATYTTARRNDIWKVLSDAGAFKTD